MDIIRRFFGLPRNRLPFNLNRVCFCVGKLILSTLCLRRTGLWMFAAFAIVKTTACHALSIKPIAGSPPMGLTVSVNITSAGYRSVTS